MTRRRTQRNTGFSLVELLSAVLVLGALAAVAVPLYTSQRGSAAARVCLANEAAIASSAAAWALRYDAYPEQLENMLGAPEGLARYPECPLGGHYEWRIAPDGSATIVCPNAARHVGFGGDDANEWVRVMPKPGRDNLP
jgi:prepilin-type N-terminal cleavage/methylation domain-containing protein